MKLCLKYYWFPFSGHGVEQSRWNSASAMYRGGHSRVVDYQKFSIRRKFPDIFGNFARTLNITDKL